VTGALTYGYLAWRRTDATALWALLRIGMPVSVYR